MIFTDWGGYFRVLYIQLGRYCTFVPYSSACGGHISWRVSLVQAYFTPLKSKINNLIEYSEEA